MGEACQLESILNRDYESVDLISFQELVENFEKLSKLSVGVIIEPSDDVSLIKDHLDSLELIVLDFNNFDDGRGYSQAYLLRKRWQFLGEVIGINAHLDQLQFMIRSGVTSYVLLDSYIGLNEEDYANGFSICYQEAANNSGLQQKY
ncbi:DUF934 domain-containing protein [Candidatus Thioglobus sp.]|nr:DUF934 domain-containing protein [Candidatus Thioglobus sp.]